MQQLFLQHLFLVFPMPPLFCYVEMMIIIITQQIALNSCLPQTINNKRKEYACCENGFRCLRWLTNEFTFFCYMAYHSCLTVQKEFNIGSNESWRSDLSNDIDLVGVTLRYLRFAKTWKFKLLIMSFKNSRYRLIAVTFLFGLQKKNILCF